MIEGVSERERLDLVSNLRGEVEERMLRDLATPPMTGEIVSHTLTLSNPIMVSSLTTLGMGGWEKFSISIRALLFDVLANARSMHLRIVMFAD